MVKVEIDEGSGFCFGVVNAIEKAEMELKQGGNFYCLGDIVHNNLEVARLNNAGLTTIDHIGFRLLQNSKVLLRAHGEPPETYSIARKNNIEIIDATCPVVLRLQKKIKACFEQTDSQKTQIVIYGKKGHAEVNGLVGQTHGTAIVIEKTEDLSLLDFTKDIVLFSQTTKPLDGFLEIRKAIEKAMAKDVHFTYYDTICRQVSGRLPKIKEFAAKHDWIYFVAGEKSSNGKVLFEECKKANPNTWFITEVKDISEPLPPEIKNVGICGATSTPKWLMEKVAARVTELNQ